MTAAGETARNLSKEAELQSLLHTTLARAEIDKSYSVRAEINGVVPQPELVNELSERFGLQLDPHRGSRIELSRNAQSGRLVLNRLSMPLLQKENLHGSIYVQGVSIGDSCEYLPFVRLYNMTTQARAETWHPGWRTALSRNVLNGHDIELQPDSDDQDYRAWFGRNVINKAKSWWLLERVELGESKIGHYPTQVAIAREEYMPEYATVGSGGLSIIHTATGEGPETREIWQTSLSFLHDRDMTQLVHISRTSAGGRTSIDRYRECTDHDITMFTDLVKNLSSASKQESL